MSDGSTIAVANLYTTEPLFKSFEVECWRATQTTAGISAGSSVVIPVKSTTGMIATNTVILDATSVTVEVVTISSVTDATHFIAQTVVSSHLINTVIVTDKIGTNLVEGQWNPSAAQWQQTDPTFFYNLVVGSIYAFRTRVLPLQGDPSDWFSDVGTANSNWQTEVAGDNTPPTASYASAVVKGIHNGGMVALNPTAADSDIACYEVYQSLTNSTPAVSVVVTDKSRSAFFTLTQLNTGLHYVWARAVDTSGNQQAWQSVGSYTPLTDAQVITSSGTAAGIAGQGALATKSYVDLATTDVTNKNLDNITDSSTYLRAPNYSAVILDNPSFEANATLPPAGWVTDGGGSTLAYETGAIGDAGRHGGARSLKVTVSSGDHGVAQLRVFRVQPGEVYRVTGWIRTSGGVQGMIHLSFASETSWLGYSHAESTAATWTFVSGVATVPAGAIYSNLMLHVMSAGTAWFDDIMVVRVASLDTEIMDGSSRRAMTGGNASYRPVNLTGDGSINPLSALDDGSKPVISIISFKMRMAGVGDVTLNAGVVNATTGDYSKTAYIYYDDPTFAGGTPSGGYQLSFIRETALNGSGRYFVGSILLPAASGSPTVGNGDGGAGAQYTRSARLLATSFTPNPTWPDANAYRGADGDLVGYTQATTTGNDLSYEVSGFSSFASWFSSINLRLKTEVTAITAGGVAYLEYSVNDGTSWFIARTITSADITADDRIIVLPGNQNTSKVRARLRIPGSVGSTTVVKTVPNSSTTVAGGGTVNWSGTGGAWTYSSCSATWAASRTGGGTKNTYQLRLSNFGFSIPSATILGVVVTVQRSGDFTNYWTDYNDGVIDWGLVNVTADVGDSVIQLIKGAGPTYSTSHAGAFDEYWAELGSTATYGASNDMWGFSSLSYTEVNASTFGLLIQAFMECNGYYTVVEGAPVNASVSAVSITVYYTAGGAVTSTAKVYSIFQEVSL